MALSREELSAIMEGISEKIGDDEDIMNALRNIQENYEELDNNLAQETENNKNLKAQYRKRFFSSGKSNIKETDQFSEEFGEQEEHEKTLDEFFKTIKL